MAMNKICLQGKNSLAPSEKAIQELENFLSLNNLQKNENLHISPAEDGEICVYFDNEICRLLLSIWGDGKYNYFFKLKKEDFKENLEENINVPLKKNILELISLKK